MKRYDLIVIGAGPGGYECAAMGAADGLSTLLIERDALGGTCLNRGCIPTKTLCRSAQIAADVADAGAYGIVTGPWHADMPAIMARKNAVVAQLREGVDMLTAGCDRISGTARLAAPDVVEVNGEQFTADRIVVATGSVAATLPVPGAELCVSSDTMLDLTELPASLVVIGGGVIGLEFASIYSALGTEVTLVEYAPEILPAFDRDVAKRLRSLMQKRGVSIAVGARVTGITQGNGELTVNYEMKGKPRAATGAMVLMAVGRRPLLPDGLTREMLDTLDPATLRIPGTPLYVIGDANGRCMLAHAASAQARMVMGRQVNMDVIPSAVFTMPECASVGLTEARAAESGLEFHTVKGMFRSNGKALAMGEPDGLVKLLLTPDGHILGCSIVGPHAADLIAEVALAMSAGLTATALTATIHAHPTLSEALAAAAASLASAT